ncbi:MAG TPA: NUDIX domain-containing protein [Acidimicrobiales bacterium]|nr:NUDIX domain-containing protein [Acidimicrobiales bacterium]
MSFDLPPTPGATVVPLRDGPDGLEVLMIERAAALAYGGMWAFPGGRVDPGDADPSGSGDEVARARRAAVREAHEEVGLRFAPESLVAYSHWTGGSTHGRLFAAWYFLAPAPDAAVVLDDHECTDHRWVRPADAVAARDRGEIAVVAPTWMTLHSLLPARTVDDALALARSRAPVVYRSRVTDAGAQRIVLWHGDAGYEAADPGLAGPRHRLVMSAAGWSFESS